jgi:GGDEF domain-containing protein
LISILKTASEMERLEKFKEVAVECYGLAISSTEQNVIEFDDKLAAAFRTELQALANRLRETTTPEQLQKIQSFFQGELREYRDTTHEKIRRLRRDLDAAVSALEEFAGNTAASGDDYEKELKQALQSLNAAAASDRLEEIHASIRSASAGILSSFEQMRAHNQFAVAQLKAEIRLLHQKIQVGRRSAAPECDTETWSQQDIDRRIDDMLRQNKSFCLVLVVLRNLKILASRHPSAVLEDALQSLQVRLQDTLGGASTLGRWTASQFVAILDVSPASAMAISRDATQKLAEPYSFECDGVRCTLSFQVAAGVVDHQAGGDVLKFHSRLEKLSLALSGGPQ